MDKQSTNETTYRPGDLSGEVARKLAQRIDNRSAVIGIIGMGYVGLPLAMATCKGGYHVIGFDNDDTKVAGLNAAEPTIGRVSSDELGKVIDAGLFRSSGDFSRLSSCDIIIICLPTPLDKFREPDLSYVVASTKLIGKHLRAGQMISLESTTYPGTTRQVMKPVLEAGGLQSGSDFFLAYSPEREDPGNKNFDTASIPKIVGGDGPDAVELAGRFYDSVVSSVVTVSSCEAAEATKLTENIFRAVNIALVNELKHIYHQMDVDIWEVIDAAATKPFGFMPFYPGPGLGGHCIPIDPFYLTWKAREYDIPTRFIELAGEINTRQPRRVIERLVDGLSILHKKPLAGSRILLIGLAYKKNVEDVRESPAFSLIELIEEKGGTVDFYDPFVPQVPPTREHGNLQGRHSVDWDLKAFGNYDAALICTDHDGIDWPGLVDAVPMIVDTRNALRGIGGETRKKVVMA